MEHQDNLNFLKEAYNGTKGLINYGELCSWYFCGEARTIDVCAHRAYRDFCRRLTGIGKVNAQEKKKWRDAEESMIAGEIERLLDHSAVTEKTFDNWHEALCTQIMKNAEPLCLQGSFTLGLAQKWVNMTFKYMIIMEQWDEKLKGVMSCLHVPVDRYIMEAAAEDCQVDVLYTNGTYGPYREGKATPWSQWEYGEYIEFQKAIRAKEPCPIAWESRAWLEVAKKRKKK